MITQIYEIQTPEEAIQMVRIGVDHIGSVVLDVQSWRQPILRQTVETVRQAEKCASLILLFNEPEAVFRALDYYQPDIVHFCETLVDENLEIDRETCDRLIELQLGVRRRFSQIEVMRSIPIAPTGQAQRVPTLALARRFAAHSDWLLTDTLLLADAPQPVQGFVGITGHTCDWPMARQMVEDSDIPVILAGGLSAENVQAAILATAPAGVDSCTRTNATDAAGKPLRFQKDNEKVRQMVQRARLAAEKMSINSEKEYEIHV